MGLYGRLSPLALGPGQERDGRLSPLALGPGQERAMAKREWKYDKHGKIREVARAEHYVMVRRPHAVPFVMDDGKWNALPSAPPSVSAPGDG